LATHDTADYYWDVSGIKPPSDADNTQNQLDFGASIDNATANGYTFIDGGYINTDILSIDYGLIIGGKPPEDADNTADNETFSGDAYYAYVNGYTFIYGGYIQSDFLNVDTAVIEDAAITNAKIDDLAVDTLKINDNAVTVPKTSQTSGSISIIYDTWTTIESLSHTSNSQPVLFFGSFVVGGWDGVEVQIRLLRGGSTIYGPFTAGVFAKSASQQFSFSYTDETPYGTYTYELQIYSASVDVFNRTLTGLLVKK